MNTYSCPSCGAAITLRSSIAVSAICPYCRTLVVKHGSDVESIGQYAVLPDDMSPLQLGTTGVHQNINFVLIGRAKMKWVDGCWNEWLILYDTGEHAWLVEAQGCLAISRATEAPAEKRIKAGSLKLGQSLRYGNKNYTVTDIKTATLVGYEGEFPNNLAAAGTMMQVIDLTGRDGAFLSATLIKDTPAEFYVGDYIAFNDLRFNYLRDLPGWEKPRTATGGTAP